MFDGMPLATFNHVFRLKQESQNQVTFRRQPEGVNAAMTLTIGRPCISLHICCGPHDSPLICRKMHFKDLFYERSGRWQADVCLPHCASEHGEVLCRFCRCIRDASRTGQAHCWRARSSVPATRAMCVCLDAIGRLCE
jgi:hypothetical protein